MAGLRHRTVTGTARVLVAVPVAVLLVACTSPGDPAVSGPVVQDAASCADLCVVPDPVVLGAVLPLSGSRAALGRAQRAGIERAVDRANAAGGVDVGGERRRVEVEVADDRGSGDLAGQLAWSLVLGRAEVTALLAPCAPHRTVLSVAEARQVPVVTGCGPLPAPAGARPPAWSWETGPSPSARADAVVRALARGGGGRLAVFLSAGQDLGPWAQAAAAAAVELTGSWRAPLRTGADGAPDWGPAVEEARAAGADLVVAVTDPWDSAALWRRLRGSGAQPRAWFASDAALGTPWRDRAGAAAHGTLTEAVGPLDEGVDAAVAHAADHVTRVVLDALSRAGDDRRRALNDALPGAGARLHGTPGGPALALAVWRDDVLVPAPR